MGNATVAGSARTRAGSSNLGAAQLSRRHVVDGAEEIRPLAEVAVDDIVASAPWRTFRWHGGQQHYSGTYWAASESGLVIYESRLELARLIFADFARVLGEPDLNPGAARRFPSAQIQGGIRYFAPSGLRRLRLLSGMVRANRPWRLVTGLSKVLVGAFATGAIALATNTIWLFADTMGPWRMGAATVLSIVAMILWLILDHELWERPTSPDERDRSVLYNTATVVTLVIGVIVLHVALFGLLLFTACLTLPPGTVLPCSGARGDLC